MIKPVRDLVYARPIFDSQRTKSGLYIPDEAVERCDQGIVMYLGPACRNLSIGDYVLFPNYTGTLMYVENERMIIMREKYIEACVDMEHMNMNINSLYFKASDGTYFNATYEEIFNQLALVLAENPKFKEWRVLNRGKNRRNEGVK